MPASLPRHSFLYLALSMSLSGIAFGAASQARADIPAPRVVETPKAAAAPAINRAALMDEAEQFRQARQWLDAIGRYQQVLDHSPGDREAYHSLVMTLSDNGNIDRAWELFQAKPEWFVTDEALRLGNERVARLARWGQDYPVSEDEAYAASRRALAEAVAQRERLPRHPADRSRRLDFDTLVILGQLQRYDEAVALYRQLRADDPVLPPYALAVAGDALLGIRQPGEATLALQQAIEGNPDDFAARILLSYAYLESERFPEAYALLRAARTDQPAWIRGPGARYLQANRRRVDADQAYALALAQGGYLPEAQAQMEVSARIAPANADIQQVLGAVYYRRGWVERALERYQIAATLDDRSVDARTGQVEALLDLHRVDEALPMRDALLEAWPRNIHVQRTVEYARRHVGWQVSMQATKGRSWVDGAGSSITSPLGNRDGGHYIDLQSPLIGNRWRLVAGRRDEWTRFDDTRVDDRRTAVGVRYAHGKLDARVEAHRPDDRWSDRTGFGAEALWRFNDILSARVLARRADPAASLQARRLGITADRLGAALSLSPNERTSWAASAEQWRYTDGNERTSMAVSLDQRLLTRPHFVLNGIVQANGGHGSRQDSPYFNPARDASLAVGLRGDHLVWRRYERELRQRLEVSAGPAWQQGFGTHAVPSARYEHEWSLGLGRALVYGISWARPVYDGTRENRVGVDVAAYWGTDR